MSLPRLLSPSAVATGLLALLAAGFAFGAFRLGFFDLDGPGPGLLPFIAALCLMVLLALMQREPKAEDDAPFRASPLLGIALCLLYAAAAPRTGFVPATLVLVTAWVRIFHRESWLRCGLLALGLTVGGYLLFGYLLRVPMPLFPDPS